MKSENIVIRDLMIPYINRKINIECVRGLNYLRGDNGCGKTILLDYIAGLRKQKKAMIQGNESIIYINQSIFFSDRLLGRDFLQFVYQLDNIRNGKKYFKEYIESFDDGSGTSQFVFELIGKQWGMLSCGEKNFLYAVVLLSLQREWYILDEPFAFVDESRKKILWDMIEKKVQAGKGVILTSHEEQEWIEESAQIVDFEEVGMVKFN